MVGGCGRDHELSDGRDGDGTAVLTRAACSVVCAQGVALADTHVVETPLDEISVQARVMLHKVDVLPSSVTAIATIHKPHLGWFRAATRRDLRQALKAVAPISQIQPAATHQERTW
jgi:hypothetical protein